MRFLAQKPFKLATLLLAFQGPRAKLADQVSCDDAEVTPWWRRIAAHSQRAAVLAPELI